MAKGWIGFLALLGALCFSGDAKARERADEGNFKKKAPYSLLAAGGVDTVVGAPDSWLASIGLAQWYKEFGNSPWDLLVRATSVGATAQLHRRARPGDIGYGAEAIADLVAHGDYRHFLPDGTRDRTREVHASRYGGKVFLTTSFDPISPEVMVQIFYGLGWKVYGEQGETAIPLPDSHAVHQLGWTTTYDSVRRTDLFILEGLEFRLTLVGERRPGFNDNNPNTIRDSGESLRVHVFFAKYHLGDVLNTQLQLEGGASAGDDAQSAPYLGGMVVTSSARAPGTNYMQFRGGAPYARASARIGVPLTDFWRLRTEIGWHAFVKADDENRDEPGTFIPSASVALSGFAGGLVPFRIEGARAFRNEGYDQGWGVMGYVLMGLGKLE